MHIKNPSKRQEKINDNTNRFNISLFKFRKNLPLMQLNNLLTFFILIGYVICQDNTASQNPGQPALRYYLISEECYDTLFNSNDWLNITCWKKIIVKILGYAVITGSTIVKVPQIIKIIKKKSTLGVSFASVILEAFTQLSAVAYNITRQNPFSVYGQTLLMAVQSSILLLLFIIYSNKKEGYPVKESTGLLVVLIVFWNAVNPVYFPKYILENALVAQMVLFAGARIFQIAEIHKLKSTGNLSIITCTMNLLGNFSRLGTAFVEVAHDVLYKFSVINALTLNSYILLCFFLFKTKPSLQAKRNL